MKTFKRVCIEELIVTDGDRSMKIERSKEYTTTPEKNGTVTVFSSWWVSGVPVKIFAGEQVFTQ